MARTILLMFSVHAAALATFRLMVCQINAPAAIATHAIATADHATQRIL
jgi:hypothetical protein